jgi:hypothetical protein
MHPLIPDDYQIRSHQTDEVVGESDLTPIQGHGTREMIDRYGLADWIYSFGLADPGAITRHNHPNALRNLTGVNGDHVDIGTIDILRDRERGVPRYNEFRQKLRKKRVDKFEDLTPNPSGTSRSARSTGVISTRSTRMSGCSARSCRQASASATRPSESFILMASRRLKSDRLFTNDYTPEVYTPEGLQWVESNLFGDVVKRQIPELTPALEGSKNAFAPWKRVR